ncbi:5'-methylthioadenosine/adenosylhomocysteine nucleosidase [Holzapfeliella sp. He02]|uniref:adenosylhomocysteine nucleosidase n=1 Tax=Holzapfeliella saturejae TaxID=3082953 RepID=A0ABU8SG31_9LACO
MKIGIIVPMSEEREYYLEQFEDIKRSVVGPTEVYEATYHNFEIVIVLSGIGKVQAAMTTTLLMQEFKPDLVIMTGSAGALSDDLEIGDVVVANELVYHDADSTQDGYKLGQLPGQPERYETSRHYNDQLLEALTQLHVPNTTGLVVTGDMFVGKLETKQYIISNFPDALCVEMEGAAIAQVLNNYQVPMVGIRSISDKSDMSSDMTFDHFVKFAGKNAAKIVFHFLDNLK